MRFEICILRRAWTLSRIQTKVIAIKQYQDGGIRVL
jgi:hypothetical protein